ncbi:MAG: GPW/gp25 family protein [Bacteroidetes bacterium]|nr:GPW/gp25 family protein [Bacteroidota bacterium]
MRRVPRREFHYDPVDTEADVAVGIKLPFNKTHGGLPQSAVAASGSIDVINPSSDGLFELSYTTEEQSTSNLKLLLLTKKGERLMHPNYGTDIQYYVFDNDTDLLRDNIHNEINSAIRYWLPYIIVVDISVTSDGEHGINIVLTYKVTENGANETIVLFVDQSGVNLE